MKRIQPIKRLHINIFLLIAIVIFQFIIPRLESGLIFYIDYLFLPTQRLKTFLLNGIPFSIGDLLYLFLIILLLYSVGRFLFLVFKRNKAAILNQGAKTITTLFSILFLFVFFWNPNYKRPKLSSQFSTWQQVEMNADTEQKLNDFLLEKFAEMDSIPLRRHSIQAWNTMITEMYQEKFGAGIPSLQSKSSMFGSLIQSMGIQGYYNPISSEAQVNYSIPECLHPFVMAHEMAHQMGIASEGDANFTAYYICVQSADAYLRYSAYFNLYLYNLRKLSNADTLLAQASKAALPQYVKDDIDTLNAFNARRPYDLNAFTIPFYDFFLQFNGEQQGIKSYGGMTKYGYVFELIEDRRTHIAIRPFNE